ncbi:MAG: TRAP transporter small permease subunit [Saprospiraceae bacterium]|nr:TRAP transporter small permease subunit [Saprospiraceae bacterium]
MIKFIESLNEKIGQAASWLTTILVVFVCFDVFRRYFLKDSSAWIMEMEWHLFAMIFLLSAGYTLKHNKHVRVDLFYEKLSKKDKGWVNLTGSLLFIIPWCVLIIWVSWNYAMNAWEIKEGSPDPGGLPARYLIKFCIPVGIFLLLLQSCVLAIQSYRDIK